MNSRERVLAALNHKEPDRIPKDLGSSVVAGIHCEALYNLRAKLGLKEHTVKLANNEKEKVKISDPVEICSIKLVLILTRISTN